MWYQREGESVVLFIKAQPNASKSRIVGVLGDALKVAIAAPAVEGAANKELVKFLAKRFKISKSAIEFVAGETSRLKRLRLPLNEKIESFLKEMDEGESL